MFIGFSGKLGAGKDFFADMFFGQLLRCRKLAFADALKREAMDIYSLSFEEVYLQKSERSRKVLQEHGVGARATNPDHWVRRVEREMHVEQLRGVQHFLLTDVRFPNEVQWITSHGGVVVRIVAPERTALRATKEGGSPGSHSSETALDNHSFEYIIYNTLRRPFLYINGCTIAFECPEHLVAYLLQKLQ